MNKLFYISLCFILVACRSSPSPVDPELLSAADFIHLDARMMTDNEHEFDSAWKELKSKLHYTLQAKGVDYYSSHDRYWMVASLEFHAWLNSDYVTNKHGKSIESVASLLEWAEMNQYRSKELISCEEWKQRTLNKTSRSKNKKAEQDVPVNPLAAP